MNKIIVLMILLASFAIADAQMDQIPPENIGDYPPEELNIEKLNSEQLANLNAEQIRYHIGRVNADQLGKMDPSAISSLSENDAKNYFADKLTNGYNPENANERELLKKLNSYSEVDVESFANVDTAEFGEDDLGRYVKTPNGAVYLNDPAHVKSTPQGIVVDGSMRLTKGEMTVDNGYMLGMYSECDLLQDGKYSGVSINSDFTMPNINPGNDELEGLNQVSFKDGELFAEGGGYTLITHENNNFRRFEATPDDSITIKYPENQVEVTVDKATVSYMGNPSNDPLGMGEDRMNKVRLLPFTEQEYHSDEYNIGYYEHDLRTAPIVEVSDKGWFAKLKDKAVDTAKNIWYDELKKDEGAIGDGARSVSKIRIADDGTIRKKLREYDSLDDTAQIILKKEAYNRFGAEETEKLIKN